MYIKNHYIKFSPYSENRAQVWLKPGSLSLVLATMETEEELQSKGLPRQLCENLSQK